MGEGKKHTIITTKDSKAENRKKSEKRHVSMAVTSETNEDHSKKTTKNSNTVLPKDNKKITTKEAMSNMRKGCVKDKPQSSATETKISETKEPKTTPETTAGTANQNTAVRSTALEYSGLTSRKDEDNNGRMSISAEQVQRDLEKYAENICDEMLSRTSQTSVVSESETDMLAKTLVNIVYKKASMNAALLDSEEINYDTFDPSTELPPLKKIAAIQKALIRGDHKSLHNMALAQSGLVNNIMRRSVWLFIYNINYDDLGSVTSRTSMVTSKHVEHPDYKLVAMDVARTLKRYPPGMDTVNRMDMQDGLITIIMDVLTDNPDLHYYQGFHDICVTLQLCMGEDRATMLAKQLARTKLRMFMSKDMKETNELLFYINVIIKKTVPELAKFLEKSEVGTIYALPMIITWFAHCLPDIDSINRLFDVFVCCETMYPIYLMASIVIYRRADIMAVDCEMTSVHHVLTQLPDDLPFDNLLSNATILMRRLPARQLLTDVQEMNKEKQLADDIHRERVAESTLRRKRLLEKKLQQEKDSNNKSPLSSFFSSAFSSPVFTLKRMTLFGVTAVVLASVWYGRTLNLSNASKALTN